jgi:hypothetical protein
MLWLRPLRPSIDELKPSKRSLVPERRRIPLLDGLFPPGGKVNRCYPVGHSSFKKTYRSFPWLEPHFDCSIGKCCVDATSCPVKLRCLARIRSISLCNARRTTWDRVACSHFASCRASAISSLGTLIRPSGSFVLISRFCLFVRNKSPICGNKIACKRPCF